MVNQQRLRRMTRCKAKLDRMLMQELQDLGLILIDKYFKAKTIKSASRLISVWMLVSDIIRSRL